mmetsp:Transcript_15040/g.30442  ORF Transcript_15040/g.30442 Transcript_15040/m.30442 type:complete len:83 (+) Transcript_15040:517-765(+)
MAVRFYEFDLNEKRGKGGGLRITLFEARRRKAETQKIVRRVNVGRKRVVTSVYYSCPPSPRLRLAGRIQRVQSVSFCLSFGG